MSPDGLFRIATVAIGTTQLMRVRELPHAVSEYFELIKHSNIDHDAY